ncbi:hypothetical protein D3C75_665640 [compost metagenome]
MLEVIKRVLMIFTARGKTQRLRIHQFGIQQQYFTGRSASQINEDEVLRGGFVNADIKHLVFFFIDQLILRRRMPHGVPPDLIRQQRFGMFSHVVKRCGVISPDKAAGDVFQHLRIPVPGFKIAETQSILAAGQEIFRQRHHRIVRCNAHSTHGVKFAVGSAAIAINQRTPLIPFGRNRRLALINGVFIPGFKNLTITIAILRIGRGDISLRDAVDHLFEQAFL